MTCRGDELAGLEFPDPAVEVLDEPSRRDFLRFMAASLALGGSAAVPISRPNRSCPTCRLPSRSFRASRCSSPRRFPIDGFACGVLVKSQMGRPIKIEGNPDHPASLGAVDTFGQAAVLELYDPDRSQMVTHNARVDTWEHFQTLALDIRDRLRAKKGAGLRILTQTVASPTLADQLRRLGEQFPAAKWHSYEPVTRDAVRAGCRLAFGEDLEPVHHLDQADVIVSLDADFLAWGPGRLKDARGVRHAARGRRRSGGDLDEPAVRRRVARRRSPAPRPITGWPCRRETSPCSPRAIAAALRVGEPPPADARLAGTDRRPRPLDRRAGARPGGPPRQEPGRCRRDAAGRGSRAGASDQPRARQRRQDGRVSRSGRCGAGRPGRLAARAGPRHERRRGRHPDHPRGQPGLRCPGGPRLRHGAGQRQDQASHPPRAV